MAVQRPCPGGRYPAIPRLMFGGMSSVCLNRWRTSRGKKRPARRRFRCSITTVVLNAKSAMELARDCGIGMSTFPAIKSVMAGCACCDSMSLIQPLLHCSHTTFAVQFSLSADQFFFSIMFRKLFSPGNKVFIHRLHTCSPESLAVDGQKAHASGMRHFTADDLLFARNRSISPAFRFTGGDSPEFPVYVYDSARHTPYNSG